MNDHGTTSIPGWYIQLQADVLLQLPRPDQIDQAVAEGWHDNRVNLKRALREALAPPKLQEWLIGNVSSGSGNQLVRQYADLGRYLRPEVETCLCELPTKTDSTQPLRLTLVTPIELGFRTRHNVGYAQMVSRANQFGLQDCPLWIGPQTGLTLKLREPGDRIIFASKPFEFRDALRVFSVANDMLEGHILKLECVDPVHRFDLEDTFAFGLPDKQ